MDCGDGICRIIESNVEITVDVFEKMVLRETTKNSKDFMQIRSIWKRDKDNNYYVLYEDKNSHGFVVLNRLSGQYFGYTDTLYTNLGGYVSSGECKIK